MNIKYELEPMKVIHKQWGSEKFIDNRPEYCGKFLTFQKGKKLSWHHHNGEIKKTETFYLLTGLLKVFLSEEDDISKADVVYMNPGDRLFIYPGLRHRMYAIEDSVLLEISTQDSPECSIRIEKGD